MNVLLGLVGSEQAGGQGGEGEHRRDHHEGDQHDERLQTSNTVLIPE